MMKLESLNIIQGKKTLKNCTGHRLLFDNEKKKWIQKNDFLKLI